MADFKINKGVLDLVYILILIGLLIIMVFILISYNKESTSCVLDPLKYAEKSNSYCNCFCMKPVK